jgi:hypothetical protein
MLKKLSKIFILTILVFSFSKTNTFAVNLEEAFSYNQDSVNESFEAVSSLETVIVNNFEEADLAFVTDYNFGIISSLNNTLNVSSVLPNADDKNPVLGIPSFAWGFCLGVIGIVVVAVVADDLDKESKQAEIKKSAIGCVVSSVSYVLVWFVILGGAAASAV